MIHVRAPESYETDRAVVFLAGSIEMDTARRWQDEVVAACAEYDIVVLNPRREHWDVSWRQTGSDPRFREQVEWELEGLERAQLVLFYFDPETKSPISLLELGLCKDRRVLVCCPDGFWRKGNVEIVCERYGIPLFHHVDEWMVAARASISTMR